MSSGRYLVRPFQNPAVASVFEAYPPTIQRKLLEIRRLIFETAAKTEGVGKLEETLKWGDPAYVTAETKSGTTVRIAWRRSKPSHYAMYFHWYEGNRALIFKKPDPIPVEALRRCVAASLTYHRNVCV